MHHRPLAFVSVLTVGDYVLWNWSLSGGHDVPALVSGLTLPPLTILLVWLLALNGARLLARSARRPSAGPGARAAGVSAARARNRRERPLAAGNSSPAMTEDPLTHQDEGRPAQSSKLAA